MRAAGAPAANTIYVTNNLSSGTVSVINGATNTVTATQLINGITTTATVTFTITG